MRVLYVHLIGFMFITMCLFVVYIYVADNRDKTPSEQPAAIDSILHTIICIETYISA